MSPAAGQGGGTYFGEARVLHASSQSFTSLFLKGIFDARCIKNAHRRETGGGRKVVTDVKASPM
jgi:hypothetical protein